MMIKSASLVGSLPSSEGSIVRHLLDDAVVLELAMSEHGIPLPSPAAARAAVACLINKLALEGQVGEWLDEV